VGDVRARLGATAVVAVAVLVLNVPAGAARAAPAEESPRAWVKGLCASAGGWAGDMQRLLSDASREVPVTETEPARARTALARTLGALAKRTARLARAIKHGGTPDVHGGKAAVGAFVNAFTTVTDSLRDAREKMKAAPVDDPAAFALSVAAAQGQLQTALSQVNLDLAELALGGRVLQRAAAAEPACRRFVNG